MIDPLFCVSHGHGGSPLSLDYFMENSNLYHGWWLGLPLWLRKPPNDHFRGVAYFQTSPCFVWALLSSMSYLDSDLGYETINPFHLGNCAVPWTGNEKRIQNAWLNKICWWSSQASSICNAPGSVSHQFKTPFEVFHGFTLQFFRTSDVSWLGFYLKYLEMVAGTRRTLYLRSSMLGIVRGCRPKNVTRGESRARSEWLGFHESFQKTSFWAINSYVRDHHILQFWLVVWLPFFIFPDIGNVIIPIDGLIFFRGVAQPPTRIDNEEKMISLDLFFVGCCIPAGFLVGRSLVCRGGKMP